MESIGPLVCELEQPMERQPAAPASDPQRIPMKLVYLTAGAAGMYCGSCMHDNTLAAALARTGVDVQLVPTYTPIRTDEHDTSVDRVFFGGVNVFLQQKFAIFRYLPSLLDRMLDQPWFLRWVTTRGLDIDPKELGALTVSMLRGKHGYQRKEVRRLCHWLAASARPDVVVMTNILIGGCIPEIKRALNVPVLVTLQGDDIFLDFLPEPYRQQAFEQIRNLADSVDGFLVHSRYYAEAMSKYFGLPPERIHWVPLGIDARGFQYPSSAKLEMQVSKPRRIGYLARLTPEKGLHILVDAFLMLRERPGCEDVQLHIAGWLGEDHRGYAEEQFARLKTAGLDDAYHYAGTVDRAGKIEFLSGLDVFTVPTIYRDPKGLYVLEALAAGVPVVQPDHGAFSELLEVTGGGCLFEPGNPQALADQLHRLLDDPELRARLGIAGQQVVHQRLNPENMAEGTLQVLRKFVTSVGTGK
jgi:glycosyltransferase involved in cell wall biosynthesis